MARPRKASDDIYNARRRAKRLIARLEKQTLTTKQEQKAAARYIAQLKSLIADSYVQRKGITNDKKAAELERAMSVSKKLNKNVRANRRGEQSRANEVFYREMLTAQAGLPSALGKHGEKSVHIFYRATQQLWEGENPTNRNEIIMQKLGVESLRDAFRYVMEQNKQALRSAAHVDDPLISTEESFFLEEAGESDDETSPIEYLASVKMILI